MKNKNKLLLRRGDIYYYDFGENEGSIQCGRRPVLILQGDDFNTKAPTVIVAAITSAIKKRYLSSHIYLGEQFGLEKPSMVLIEQIQTVNKADLEDYIGYVDDEQIWRLVNIALKKTFGMWFYKRERSGEIRCLCPKCLKDYKANPAYNIRRVDPYSSAKDKCDKCDSLGYDYMVYDKRTALGSGVKQDGWKN